MQFTDRVKDIEEIGKMQTGKGKGRVRRDRKKHAELLRTYNKPVPEGWNL